MTQTPWWHDDDPAGNAGVEAARLFEVIRDRLLSDPATMRAGLRVMEIATQFTSAPADQPGAAPECAYCPVCQAIRQARSVSPETVERLTSAAIDFAETVRQTLSDDETPAERPVRHVPLDDDIGAPSPGDGAATSERRADTPDDDGFAGWPSSTAPRD